MRWATRLGELAAAVPACSLRGDPDILVEDVVEDTRLVTPGALFIARAGSRTDGRTLIEEARARGAVAVLGDVRACERTDGASLCCEDSMWAGCRVADVLWGDPCDSIPIIAVTGTNGKTTTATFLQHLMAREDRPIGLIGSIEVDDGVDRTPARLTTPGPIELRRLLARMIANGCGTAVMEASSHGIALGRLAGIRPAGAIFTNLSGDHLDFHGTMDRYAAAKRALFSMVPATGVVVLNMDDDRGPMMAAATAARVITCGTDGDITVHHDAATGQVRVSTSRGEQVIGLSILGAHNAMNLAQAWAMAQAMGPDPTGLAARCRSLPMPPGRLERVISNAAGAPSVFVDFAHTDEALATALRALRPLVADSGRLQVIFGCGGDRDTTKRPRMAQVACRLADAVIVTSDNPRTESPQRIIDDILLGAGDTPVRAEVDRALAIESTVAWADSNDVILIAGKGHECEQLVGDRVIPFDDRVVAARALQRRTEGVC